MSGQPQRPTDGNASRVQADATSARRAESPGECPGIPTPDGLEWLQEPTPAQPFVHNWGHGYTDYCTPAWQARVQLRGHSRRITVDLGEGMRYHKVGTPLDTSADWARLFVRFNGHMVTQFVETKDGLWANVIRPDGWKRLRFEHVPHQLPRLYQAARIAAYADVSAAKPSNLGHLAVVVIGRYDLRSVVHHAAANWLAKQGIILQPAPAIITSSEAPREEVPPNLTLVPYVDGHDMRNETPATIKPGVVDPDAVARGKEAHQRVQDELARHLRVKGLKPQQPKGEPQCDLVWETQDGTLWVAEVKSLTDSNEQYQLRLGLGQVLWYRHLLTRHYTRVQAALVAERRPSSPTWATLCAELGVKLIWPGNMAEHL